MNGQPILAVSGRMVSVTATSGEQETAENMATWIAGSEVSLQISPSSSETTLFRGSQEPDAGRWLAGAQRHEGSWWEHWAGWLGERSGEQFAAAESLGSPRFPALEAAPGSYVHQ